MACFPLLARRLRNARGQGSSPQRTGNLGAADGTLGRSRRPTLRIASPVVRIGNQLRKHSFSMNKSVTAVALVAFVAAAAAGGYWFGAQQPSGTAGKGPAPTDGSRSAASPAAV